MVEPGHPQVSGTEGRATDPNSDKKVYFTDKLAAARTFRSNVYEVEPTGPHQPDAHFPPTEGSEGMQAKLGAGEVMFKGKRGYEKGTAYESEAPLRVVRNMKGKRK
jgi:hypothetical protein